MEKAKWQQMGFRRQMGNITSELVRAAEWETQHDIPSRNAALERALELIDLAIECSQGAALRELCRFREVTADCYASTREYEVTLQELTDYGMSFLR